MRLYDLNFFNFRNISNQLFFSRFFLDVAGGMAEYDSPFDTLATLAEVGVPGFSRKGVPGFSRKGVPRFSRKGDRRFSGGGRSWVFQESRSRVFKEERSRVFQKGRSQVYQEGRSRVFKERRSRVFWEGRSRVLKDLSPRWMATLIWLSQRSLAALVVDFGDCAGRFYVPSPPAIKLRPRPSSNTFPT